MTGAVRFYSLSFVLLACGGADKPAESPAAPTTATPAPAEASSSNPGPAASAAATPSSAPDVWPFKAQTEAERKEQLDRLAKDKGPIRTNWTPPGKSERYGRAEGIIAAPVDVVRAKLQDYAHYKDLAGPKFKTVRVIDKQGNDTDVYFQLPIMKGLITINYTTRFKPIQGDVIEGKFVKGNIKDMNVAWTVRPGPDDKSSIMTCDILLVPNVPAPQDALDEELRDACGDAINAVRKTLGAN
jgi:hypothetical protein